MDCNLLNADINPCSTPAFKGYKRRGWYTMRSNIDDTTIDYTDCQVKFWLKSGMFYQIEDESTNPFMGSGVKIEKSSNHGYTNYNQVVKFPLKAFNPKNSVLVDALTKGTPLVFILELEEKGTDDVSRYQVFGLDSGLICTVPMYEMANDSVWEVEMQEDRSTNPATFLYDTDLAGTTELASRLLNYEWITGLNIPNGETTPKLIYIGDMDAGSNKIIAIVINRITGEVVTEFVGNSDNTIDVYWEGVTSNVTILIPKEIGSLIISGNLNGHFVSAFAYDQIEISETTGIYALTVLNAVNIVAQNITSDTVDINVQKATSVDFAFSSQSAEAIEKMLIDLDEYGNEDGNVVLTGGSNAYIETWSSEAVTAKNNLVAKGWTVDYMQE